MRNSRVTSTAEAITMFETAVCAPALQLTADRENDPEKVVEKGGLEVARESKNYKEKLKLWIITCCNIA